jgi:very-short-patch-repair endonuclease
MDKKQHETDIEKMMRLELSRRGLVFEQFFPVRSGFQFDFAFPDKRVAVECDGEKWHPVGNKRDSFRAWIVKRGGWTTLRFRGEEIKSDVSRCVDQVVSVITNK